MAAKRTFTAWLVMHRSGTPFDKGEAYFIPVSSLQPDYDSANAAAFRNNPMFKGENFDLIRVKIEEVKTMKPNRALFEKRAREKPSE